MAGYSGHGFKLASAMGVVAADVIIEGRSSLPVDHLSIDRFAASFQAKG